jgi:hypothetical protein
MSGCPSAVFGGLQRFSGGTVCCPAITDGINTNPAITATIAIIER